MTIPELIALTIVAGGLTLVLFAITALVMAECGSGQSDSPTYEDYLYGYRRDPEEFE